MSTMTASDTGRERGFHSAHVGHLVMGLAFLGLVAIWVAVQSDWVATNDVRWLLPLPWVFAGAAGLIAAVVSGRRRAAPETAVGYSAPAYRPEETAYAAHEPIHYDEPEDGVDESASDQPTTHDHHEDSEEER